MSRPSVFGGRSFCGVQWLELVRNASTRNLVRWAASARQGMNAFGVWDGRGSRMTGAVGGVERSRLEGPETGTLVVAEGNGDMPSLTFMGSGAAPVPITEYPVPTANSQPCAIGAGSDGALWFAENTPPQIGRITAAGARNTSTSTCRQRPRRIRMGRPEFSVPAARPAGVWTSRRERNIMWRGSDQRCRCGHEWEA